MFRIRTKKVLEDTITIKSLNYETLRAFLVDIAYEGLEAPKLSKEEVEELKDPILFLIVAEIVSLSASNMGVTKPNKLIV